MFKVVGATTGCVVPPKGYFRAVREVCDKYGALLILDEVMCGMGRTGTMHAWQQFGVPPDIQTCGKALGGGYQPISAVLFNGRIVDAIQQGTGLINNGQTYQAHPIACAAALEVQRIIRFDSLLGNCKVAGEYLGDRLRVYILPRRYVGDVRGAGLFWAVEIVCDKQTKESFHPSVQFSARVNRYCQERGLSLYPGAGTSDGIKGDHLLISPPYSIHKDLVDDIVEGLAEAIEAISDEVESGRRIER